MPTPITMIAFNMIDALGRVRVARWMGSQVLATIANKGGQMFAMITYEVSADGRTLTSKSSGILEQVIVFDRQ